MKISVISFTEKGDELNLKLKRYFSDSVHYGNEDGLIKKSGSVYDWAKENFKNDALIFIGATGIAVRAIAPLVDKKDTDPAVIVIDETGSFVIPILSGHIGGANELAAATAKYIGAVPVITTATDINNVWQADTWAVKNNCVIDDISKIKYISGALLRGVKVGLVSDFEICSELPKGIFIDENTENGIAVTVCDNLKPFKNTLKIIPKCIHIGVGSRRDANPRALIDLYVDLKSRFAFSDKAVADISTIDIKKEEPSVKEFCGYLNSDLKLYTAEELNAAEGEFSSSDFVMQKTGTDNVCERSAVKSGGERFFVRKTAGDGVTMAIAIEEYKIDWRL